VADELRFVALRAFARPPRLLVVVPYVEAEWVHWAAAGLGALSQVWGGCAGVVVPASVVAHPSLADLMRRMQPDHVLAYTPSGATVEGIRPGVIDQMVGGLEGEARDQSEAFVRAEPWHHREALVVEEAAAGLRERLGVNATREMAQETHLFDDPAKAGLTVLTDVAIRPVLGVPFPLVSTPSALAYAARVGVDLDGAAADSRIPEEARWREGVSQHAGTALLDWLPPSSPQDTLAMLDPTAGRCARLERDRFRAEPVVVLGDRPEDFALAQLADVVHGPCMWVPWRDPNPMTITGRFARWRGSGLARVTSASMPPADVEARMPTMWERRPRAFVDGEEVDNKAFECVPVNDLRTSGQSLYVHDQAWDLRDRCPPLSCRTDRWRQLWGFQRKCRPGSTPPATNGKSSWWRRTTPCRRTAS
jgi:hypothetical protein